ncbi:MAG: NAD(P)-dependent oxidoreductase [Gammaproteobacteria bacterium]|nr:NAD(P)-dependent oxidoreductase [Gammaproteobacteria bacterium]
MTTDLSPIGFIGLGLMGKPMALNLSRAGRELVVYNRSATVVDEFTGLGIASAATPGEVAHRAPVVIVMVSDTRAVEDVLFGPEGVVSGIAPGAIVVDMGTTEVLATRRFAERLAAGDVDYVDAPVSGGVVGAQAGSLAIMVGARAPTFAEVRPVFEILGENITHVGDIGAGQVAKAANQIIVGLTIGAVAEALSLAKRAGVDPAKVRAALAGGFAGSRILELHGQRMIDGRFEPGGKAVTQRKDLFQALALAQTLGLKLPATALNMELYDRLIEAGGGELDHSALVKVIDVANT